MCNNATYNLLLRADISAESLYGEGVKSNTVLPVLHLVEASWKEARPEHTQADTQKADSSVNKIVGLIAAFNDIIARCHLKPCTRTRRKLYVYLDMVPTPIGQSYAQKAKDVEQPC